MKTLKLIFLIIMVLSTITIKAQIKVDSNGKVMVGSSSSPTKDLDIRGDVNIKPLTANYSFIIDNTGGYQDSYPVLYPNVSNYVNLGKSDKYFYRVYSSQFCEQSDKRLKENIRDIENPLTLIQNLKGVKYDMKMEVFMNEDSFPSNAIIEEIEKQRKDQIGFIAQDVIKVLPEAVAYDELTDAYSINYSSITPVIVEAIKEQQSQIEILQTEIEKLQNNDPKLKSTAENGLNTASQLFQNQPNPFSENTYITYYLPDEVNKATIYIYDLQGRQIKGIDLSERGDGSTVIHGSELNAGTYHYTLIVDGQVVGTHTMILTD